MDRKTLENLRFKHGKILDRKTIIHLSRLKERNKAPVLDTHSFKEKTPEIQEVLKPRLDDALKILLEEREIDDNTHR